MTKTFIALLRAVNVGGANSLGTKDLVRLLESLGLTNVKTYIQSGNAIFQANQKDAAFLSKKISAKIQRSHGFAPEVILLRPDELEAAMKLSPYPGANSDPKALHLMFLASTPKNVDVSVLENLRKDSEKYSLQGRIFYFWAPEGVGRSKLFSRIEKSLGVAGTARNWRTLCKLQELAEGVAAKNQSSGDSKRPAKKRHSAPDELR